jgi:hypothetical protein
MKRSMWRTRIRRIMKRRRMRNRSRIKTWIWYFMSWPHRYYSGNSHFQEVYLYLISWLGKDCFIFTLQVARCKLCLCVCVCVCVYVCIYVCTYACARACIRGCIQKFPDWIKNEINNNNNKHSLRSNTKGYGDKTH